MTQFLLKRWYPLKNALLQRFKNSLSSPYLCGYRETLSHNLKFEKFEVRLFLFSFSLSFFMNFHVFVPPIFVLIYSPIHNVPLFICLLFPSHTPTISPFPLLILPVFPLSTIPLHSLLSFSLRARSSKEGDFEFCPNKMILVKNLHQCICIPLIG